MKYAKTIAVDLAKNVFELAVSDSAGHVLERRRLSRAAFQKFMDALSPSLVIMEACGGAHHWGRRFQRQGHEVRLLPARDIRPYVKGNKTDRNDVTGMLEANRRANIHAVPVKTPEQQGVLTLHRIREVLKRQRTATANLLRGVLREFGICIPMGMSRVIPEVRGALEDAENDLPFFVRDEINEFLYRLVDLEDRMLAIEGRLNEYSKGDPRVQRFLQVPGIGLLTATALAASVGTVDRFKNGRQFSAWLGLTPTERSSGERRWLGRITKRGDVYLRTLLIHCARSILQSARIKQKKGEPLNRLQEWGISVSDRQGHNRAACAMANKLVRRIWAMEHHGHSFDPNHISQRPIMTG